MRVLDGVDAKLARWIVKQPMFFVATAPLAQDGHVNVSPKGMGGTFAVLDQYRVAYLDYFGSGAETIAHLRENGRITVMFAAFAGKPNIVRLYGRGRVVLPEDAEFDELRTSFGKDLVIGQRAIVVVDLDRVQDSCGWAVPLMDYVSDRTVLDGYMQKKGPKMFENNGNGINAESIDGLPALPKT